MSYSPEYYVWRGIKARCTNVNSPQYINYGGRGITICKEWEKSFESFLCDVGPRPSKEFSIDRIDNSKGYIPGNVRWARNIVQQRNKRTTKYITIDGITKPVGDWADISGTNRKTICARLRYGWPPSEAVFGKNK